jgi:hypothetical protein
MLRVQTRPKEIRRRRSGFHGDRRRVWQEDASEIGQRTNHDRAHDEWKNVGYYAPTIIQSSKRHNGLSEVTAAMYAQTRLLCRKTYLHGARNQFG